MQVAHTDEIRRAYYLGFLAVLVGCFSPFKAVAYLLPAVFTLWMALHGGIVRDRLATIGLAVAGGAVVFDLLAREFLVVNYLVAMLTYSTIVPVLVIDSRRLASRALFEKLGHAMTTMMLVQGIVGIVQAVYGATQTGTFSGANGDHVAGTIYPHLAAEYAFSNPMFAVNMALMLLACLALPGGLPRQRRGHVVIGAIALVLASVLHVLVFLVASTVAAFFVVRTPRAATGRRQPRHRLLAVIALLVGFSYIALPENVASISHVAETAFDLDAVDIPRAIMLGRVLVDLPDEDPVQPYVGLGPGQFSSRASLIMSGVYLGGEDAPKALPFITPRVTRLADEYCIALMLAARDAEADVGSSQQPFFSWLSIYTELGLVGLVVVFAAIGRLVLRIRRRARARPELRTQALLLCAGVGLLTLLGWQADYWEVPQAILVGVLALKVLYANVMYGDEADAAR